jgi:hypothetical protein
MSIATIAIAVVVALVLLTLIWGLLRPSEQRPARKQQEKRYGSFRRAGEDTDAY